MLDHKPLLVSFETKIFLAFQQRSGHKFQRFNQTLHDSDVVLMIWGAFVGKETFRARLHGGGEPQVSEVG